jgi:hypothetical protein
VSQGSFNHRSQFLTLLLPVSDLLAKPEKRPALPILQIRRNDV